MSETNPTCDEQLGLAAQELDRLVRRLHALSGLAWATRRGPVVAAASRLTVLTGLAEQRQIPPLPELNDHALADVVAVVGADVLRALRTRPDSGLVTQVIAEIRLALEATR